MNVLVLAAHPDDEVLGCGGTIARLTGEGHSVAIAILGEGMTSRYAKRETVDRSLVRALHARSREVADILGARDLIKHNLPDNRFDTVALLDVVKMIEQIVEKISPRVIYTHHGGDLNIDHEIVFRATLTATRPVTGASVQTIYAYEVPSSTEWAFQSHQAGFSPNVFTDIDKTLAVKLKAMAAYESEVRSFPHPRSADALTCIARRWGSAVGLAAAEAFELVREVC